MAHPYGAMRQSLNYSQFIFTSLCGDNTAFSLGFLLIIHRVNRTHFFKNNLYKNEICILFVFLNGRFAIEKAILLIAWLFLIQY